MEKLHYGIALTAIAVVLNVAAVILLINFNFIGLLLIAAGFFLIDLSSKQLNRFINEIKRG